MRKSLIVALSLLFVVTGCGKSDSEKIKSKYGSSNEKIVKKLESKDDMKTYFGDLMVLDDNLLSNQLGVRVEDVENYVGAIPYVLDSKFYIAIKPKKDNKKRVKESLDAYASQLENRIRDEINMNTEMSEETKVDYTKKADMVKNHLAKEVNGYYVYISSEDNEKVLKIMTENLK